MKVLSVNLNGPIACEVGYQREKGVDIAGGGLTTSGVGETVVITSKGVPATWKIYAGSGTLSNTTTASEKVTFTASDVYSSAIVEAQIQNGPTLDITFTILSPTDVDFLRQSTIPYGVDNAGAGMLLYPITVKPLSVSFGNISIKEIPGYSENAVGYLKNYYATHNINFIDVGDDNVWNAVDKSSITDLPPPYSYGYVDLQIPWHYKVIGTSSETGFFFVTVKSEASIGSTGTVTKTKGTATGLKATVTRRVTEP